MTRAVVFDAYGTLIDTGTGSVDATREILKKRGREDISPSVFYADWKKYHRAHIDALSEFVCEEEIFRRDLRKLYSCYGIDGDADSDVSIMLDTMGNRCSFPEAAEVINALSGSFVLCIGSTSDTLPLLRDVERNRLGIEEHLVFTSELLRTYKPRREFYIAIAERIHVDYGEILFVGDSLIDDVFGPSQVGMKTCHIDRKAKGSAGFLPDYTVKNLFGLLEIL